MNDSDEEINSEESVSRRESKCVGEIVRAILILDQSKKPFRQSDITGFLSGKPSRKMWTSAFDEAKERLKKMGLNLRETKNTNSKLFFLTSNLFPFVEMHRYAPDEEVADRILLTLILTFIFARERPVTDVDVFDHLHRLKIFSHEKPVHEYFGDIKRKVLIEFVGQMYLEKVVDKESDTVEIKWGERANAEVTKKSILEFICKLGYGGTIEPKNFISHYMKVVEEEKEESEMN